VLVNEIRVNATSRGARWWAMFWLRNADRFEVGIQSLGGAVVWVPCDSTADAQWLAAHMTDQGVPPTAVTVTTRHTIQRSLRRVGANGTWFRDLDHGPDRR
jgi:hypothetical protein